MGGEAQGAYGKGRVQPVKPVALFSGVVPVGPDGRVSVPFQMPSYRGQVRVMAIVAGASRIGRAETDITVRDPLVVQTTVPRFVAQNDELQIPVFLTNMSGQPLDITVKVESANLPIVGMVIPKSSPTPITWTKDAGHIKLDNGRNDTVVFQAKVAVPVGGAKL